MAAPEYEPQASLPEQNPEVMQYPEQIEIPAYIEKGGVQPVPNHPASLQDPQSGVTVAQNMTMQPAVVIPADQQTLRTWSKGSPSSSQTWLGVFWERVVKRALLLGRKVTVQ